MHAENLSGERHSRTAYVALAVRVALTLPAMRRVLAAAAVAAAMLAVAGPAHARLLAGVGRADITPPTGYFMMGWVRSDAQVTGPAR